eukprot:221459-Prymnesium_polylepis.1
MRVVPTSPFTGHPYGLRPGDRRVEYTCTRHNTSTLGESRTCIPAVQLPVRVQLFLSRLSTRGGSDIRLAAAFSRGSHGT